MTNKNSHLPLTKRNNNTVTRRFRKRNHLPRRFRRFLWNRFQIRQIDCIKPKNLKPVSVRFRKSITALIYNTNRNLFLWIEIFISTMDLYNATADRWSCHLPNRNKTRRLPKFLFVIIELFSLALTVQALQGKTCQNSLLLKRAGQFELRFQGKGSSLGEYFFVSTKLDTFWYMIVQNAPCYVQSFWHNTGVSQTDGRTDRQTDGNAIASTALASCNRARQ